MAKDIVATIGTYQDRNGEKKYINRAVGKIIQTKYGEKIKMDASFNPAGLEKTDDGSVWLAVFEQKNAQPDDDVPPF